MTPSEIIKKLRPMFPRMSQRDLVQRPAGTIEFFLPGTSDVKDPKDQFSITLADLSAVAKEFDATDVKITFGVYHVRITLTVPTEQACGQSKAT